MSKAQQVVDMVRQLTGLECEVEVGPCEGQRFHDWDTTGEYAMDCPRMGPARPTLENVPYCDRCFKELQ